MIELPPGTKRVIVQCGDYSFEYTPEGYIEEVERQEMYDRAMSRYPGWRELAKMK